MNTKPYYKSLDGVRGIAVLMVMLIHSRLLPIGWVGVQIFFVLSGFLITGILQTQKDRPLGAYLRRFYWHRTLRIWPLYFFFLALCGVAFLFFRLPDTWAASWKWLVSFTYNLVRISPRFKDSDYFGHFWTLCIEEQFYLVWPFVVYWLPLPKFRRLVVGLILAGPLIRYLTGVVFAHHFDSTVLVQKAVHNMPTSHLDAFACGALLATLPPEWRIRLAQRSRSIFLALVGLVVGLGLAQAYLLRSKGLPPHWLALGYDNLAYFGQYVWAYSVLNLAGLAFLFCAIEDHRISKFLTLRPLVYVGTISYGLYVWHLPLLAPWTRFWRADPHSISGFARFSVYFMVTLGIATLSYFGLERHFLRMKSR